VSFGTETWTGDDITFGDVAFEYPAASLWLDRPLQAGSDFLSFVVFASSAGSLQFGDATCSSSSGCDLGLSGYVAEDGVAAAFSTDFSLNVSQVPAPAAFYLLVPALLTLVGLRRK